MEFSNKCCIGCMSAYTSGYYVYFNKMIDKTNKYHITFIFNQTHDMYITSLLKNMEAIFVALLNLSFHQTLIKWMNTHIQIVAQLSKFNVWKKINNKLNKSIM